MSVTGGVCGSVDSCICQLLEVYVGVLLVVSACYRRFVWECCWLYLSVTGVWGSVDGCVCLFQVYAGVLMVVSVCYRRCMWEC